MTDTPIVSVVNVPSSQLVLRDELNSTVAWEWASQIGTNDTWWHFSSSTVEWNLQELGAMDNTIKNTYLKLDQTTPQTTTGQLKYPTAKFWWASDNTEFEADWTMKANWNATTYDDMLWDITKLKTVWHRVSYDDAECTMDFNTACTLTDYARTNYQLTHRRKAGSTIFPHIHREQTENNVPNRLIQYRRQKQWWTKTTARTNYKSNTNAFTYVSWTLNQISHDSWITAPAWYGISDIIQIRLIRDTANTSTLFSWADPFTTTAKVTSVDIHVETDTLWSRSEYTK